MKIFKAVLAFLFLVLNLVIAQPSFADPIAEKSPEYAQITQQLNQLLQARSNPSAAGYNTAEELQKSISDLQFQKYVMETTEDWGVCRNETGKTLAVYAHKPSKNGSSANTLFYLGNGQKTDEDWDCDGIYVPSGVNVAGVKVPVGENQEQVGENQEQQLGQPLFVKIVDGTQLIARTNALTGEIELNAPPAGVVPASEQNPVGPNFSQAQIDAQVPNAPID
ncbi:hypothetical protein SD80_006820 [Scytonema tolypothrichoides VB-61278]|nr:hypothetical protein SD80_006820 [Scytonema tolypothrichoides VB-61278]